MYEEQLQVENEQVFGPSNCNGPGWRLNANCWNCLTWYLASMCIVTCEARNGACTVGAETLSCGWLGRNGEDRICIKTSAIIPRKTHQSLVSCPVWAWFLHLKLSKACSFRRYCVWLSHPPKVITIVTPFILRLVRKHPIIRRPNERTIPFLCEFRELSARGLGWQDCATTSSRGPTCTKSRNGADFLP